MTRLSWISLTLALAFVLLDFQARFLPEQRTAERLQQNAALGELPNLTLTEPERQELAELYRHWQEEIEGEEGAVDVVIPDEQAQANQSGILTAVYAGDKRLSLRAVINDSSVASKRYALISVEGLKDKSSALTKVADGASLFGFDIKVISNVEIALYRHVDNGPSEQADISLVMYKPVGKESI